MGSVSVMFNRAWKQLTTQLLEKPKLQPAVSDDLVLPAGAKQQTTMLIPYGMLPRASRHFFSDGMFLSCKCFQAPARAA